MDNSRTETDTSEEKSTYENGGGELMTVEPIMSLLVFRIRDT